MIDWMRVAELREEIGPEDFSEIVELFLSEVEHAIVKLEEAEGNPAVIADQMHFLKGASLNLGFAALATICRDGERAAMDGNPDLIPALEVRRIFETAREAFAADFPQRFAA